MSFCSFSVEGGVGSDVRREKKSRPEVRGERKSNRKQYFGLLFMSVLSQICNGTDRNGIILAHIQHLMGDFFVFRVANVPNIWHLPHLLWVL